MNKWIFRVMSIVFIMSLAGCASYRCTKSLVLDYKTITPVQESNDISINVIAFKDNRGDKKHLGVQTSGLPFEGGGVITKTNVSEWITNSLKAELQNSGYKINDKNSKIKLSGIVEKVSSNSDISYVAEISIRLVLVKGNETLLNKLYTGRSKDLCWVETSGGFTNILKKALQNTMSQIIADINGILLT